MIYLAILVLNLYFALTLLTSGLSKLASPDYGLFNVLKLPTALLPAAQISYQTLAWVEIGISVLLATNTNIRWAAIANIALFSVFVILQIVTFSVIKGTNCGCFGNIYKIKNDQMHITVTTVQLIFSYVYYRLIITYTDVWHIQTVVSLFMFSACCTWIFIRRLSWAAHRKLPTAGALRR